MKRQMWIIFIVMASLQAVNSQIIDDFSTVNGPISQSWSGNTEKFVINPLGQLQLKGDGSSTSSLYQNTKWTSEMSWEMYFKMDFNPSNNNRLEIFLWSDTTSLGQGNSYLLRIGENGNLDAIRLITINNGDRTEVALGSLGLVAEGPIIIRMKAAISNGILRVEIDDLGAQCFLPEIEALVNTPDIGTDIYFGWTCIYTSSRDEEFFFDDIYVGEVRIDSTSPSISQVLIEQESVDIVFSEPIDSNSINNSTFQLAPSVDGLEIKKQKQSVTLLSSNGFDNSVSYFLRISEIKDLAGNSLDTMLEFIVPKGAEIGDLLINEILFNPKFSGADFVEIYNNSDLPISLNHIFLINSENGDSSPIGEVGVLDKNSFLVLTDDKANIVDSYPMNDSTAIFEMNIPRFNNDDGNVSIVLNDVVIDSFNYDEDMHQQLIDDVDGISLERISLDQGSDETTNWASALSSSNFATPGLTNSVAGNLSTDGNFIEIESKVFSPNGDGTEDIAKINFNLESGGNIASIRIYNDSGRLQKILAQNQILASSGTISWDGRNDHDTFVPIGLYIIHVSLFSLDGNTIQKKLTIGVGDRLN